MTKQELATVALDRARSGRSLANYPAIVAGFIERGIPAEAISPRENVFTYHAWRALGRQVRKGEHWVKVLTWVDRAGKADPETGEETAGFRFPRSTTVFHVSQTDGAA